MKGWRAFGLRYLAARGSYCLTPLWRTDVPNPWLGPVAHAGSLPLCGDHLGLWAMRTRVGVLTYLFWNDAHGDPSQRAIRCPAIIGEVELAGCVIEHELGYRAEKAAIRSLQMWGWADEGSRRIADSLSATYGCDVELLPVPPRPGSFAPEHEEVEATVEIMERENRGVAKTIGGSLPVAQPHGLPAGATQVLSRGPHVVFGSRPATVRFMDGPLKGMEKQLDPREVSGGKLYVAVALATSMACIASAAPFPGPDVVRYRLFYDPQSDIIKALVD